MEVTLTGLPRVALGEYEDGGSEGRDLASLGTAWHHLPRDHNTLRDNSCSPAVI